MAGPGFGKNAVVGFTTVGSATCVLTAANFNSSEAVNLSRQCLSAGGLPGERELADVTCIGGAVSKEWLVGLLAGDMTFSFILDQSTAVLASTMERSAWKTMCNATTDDSDARHFYFCPAGTGSGNPLIMGECWVGGVTMNVTPLEPVTFTVEASLGSTLSISTLA